MDIYIARGEERKGPYTAERIWQMLADGKLDGTELACHEGMDEWVNVRFVRPVSKLLWMKPLPPQEKNREEEISPTEFQEDWYIWSIGTLSLEVCQGNLLEAPERAWVNSEQTNFILARGDRSISSQLNAEHPEAQKELYKQVQGKTLRPGTVLETSGPFGRKIYHAGFHEPNQWLKLCEDEDEVAFYLETIRECVEKAIMMAIDSKLPDIAFPLIGTGIFKLPVRSFSSMFFETVARIAMQSEANLKIVLYVYSEEDVDKVVGYGTQSLASMIDGGRQLLQPAWGHPLVQILRPKVRAHADELLQERNLLHFAEIALATDLAVLANHFKFTTDDLLESCLQGRTGIKLTFGLIKDRLRHGVKLIRKRSDIQVPPWLGDRLELIKSKSFDKVIDNLTRDRNAFAHHRPPRPVDDIVKDIETVFGPDALGEAWPETADGDWIRKFDGVHGLFNGMDKAQGERTWLLPETRMHHTESA